MKTKHIVLFTVFCSAMAGSLLHFSSQPAHTSKIQDRADPETAAAQARPDPSGKPNHSTLYKSNNTMPAFLSEAIAAIWIERERKKRLDPEIADIVVNQQIVPCDLPGRVRMADGFCWLPEMWRKLHPGEAQ